MKEKLTEKDIKHVVDLARLKELDLDRYKVQLNDILSEIDKILDVDIKEKEIMISPSENMNCYHEDEPDEMIDKKDVLKMANKSKGDFIVVSRVIHD